MGAERAKDVLDKYPNIIVDYKKYTKDQLVNMLMIIDGWEMKTSSTFADNFQNFIDFYEDIKKYISIDTTIEEKKEGKLSGMKIVISGFRDANLEKIITNNGGELSSGVSRNTTILIIKDESINIRKENETSKVTKAKELGVKIYTIDEFYAKYDIH
jgi:NAD-dependent DNA ligase